MNREFKFYQKNPHLVDMSNSELMAQDYTLFNGVEEPLVSYESITRVKMQSAYQFESLNGQKHVEVIKTQKDILDETGKIIGIEFTHNWIPTKGDWLTKIDKKIFSSKKLTDILINRRKNIKNFLLNRAENSDNSLIVSVFDLIFYYLQLELNIYIQTGDFSHLHKKIDDAPTTNDTNIIALFKGAKNTPTSIAQVFELEVEKDLIEKDVVARKMKIHEYLKFYIK